MPLLGIVLFERENAEQFADPPGADRIYIGDLGASYFDDISAEDVKLFHLKQTYKSLLSLSETMDYFCLAGSAQQAQQSAHLAQGLNPL